DARRQTQGKPGRLAWSGNDADHPEKRRPSGLGQKRALCPPSPWPVRPAPAAKRWRPNHPVFASSARGSTYSELPQMTDLDQLVRDLGHPGVPWQLGVLLGCLLVAFAVCWFVGRRHSPDSVWFGRAIVDGLLFPLLALVLTYGAMLVMARSQPVALLKVTVTVLIALAGIRFLARVLAAVFPHSAMARLMERLFSWLAWIAAVLWIVGVLPPVMEEMDAIYFVFGKSKVSLLSLVQGLLSSGVVLVVALWISAVLERRILRETVHDLSLRRVATNAIRAVLLLVGVLFALSTVGVDLTALSVLGGAV